MGLEIRQLLTLKQRCRKQGCNPFAEPGKEEKKIVNAYRAKTREIPTETR